eukprot:560211-Heterocapsa_arctica.AAC.1
MGLINDHNVPIQKPWIIATNDGYLWRAINRRQCPGKFRHPIRQRLEGKYTRISEEYTWPMTDQVHSAWRESTYALDKGLETTEAKAFRNLNRGVIPAMPFSKLGEPVNHHRDKSSATEPAYNAMVARLQTAKSISEDPKAHQAILNEGNTLASQGTWDLDSVREKSDRIREAKAKGKKLHLARIFPAAPRRAVNYRKEILNVK